MRMLALYILTTHLGGLSHLFARYGFAFDNVANYQVVLASGAIVSVNAILNPDLVLRSWEEAITLASTLALIQQLFHWANFGEG